MLLPAGCMRPHITTGSIRTVATVPYVIEQCPTAGQTQICGLEKPEDLAYYPSGKFILISENGIDETNGNLSLLDREAQSVRKIKLSRVRKPPDPKWNCGGFPSSFKPRGVDFTGTIQTHGTILVVNGLRPARIERFLLDVANPEKANWAGCISVPVDYALNDIVFLPDGGFAATHMFDPEEANSNFTNLSRKFIQGKPTGYVVRWRKDGGWSKIANSDGSFPNGIVFDREKKQLIFASTFSKSLTSISLNGRNRKDIEVGVQPDNITQTSNGTFITVGNTGLPITSTRGCHTMKAAACGFPFAVVEISENFKKVRTIFNADGKYLPGASVALVLEKHLYLGTAFGDRISIVSIEE